MPLSGVRNLDALTDPKLAQLDKAYLEKHQLDKLFNEVLLQMIQEKPQDPLQYIIDVVQYNTEYAKQDPDTGLPEHRKSKLMDVFRIIDKEQQGRISFQHLVNYTSKYGGMTLGNEELSSMFHDFQPGRDNYITLTEFLKFFSKVSRTIPNTAFERMIKELSS